MLLLLQVRLAAKVYNCSPEQLPVETHQTLASLLSCGVNGMTGSIRPGCAAHAALCCNCIHHWPVLLHDQLTA
jgi:hypothetical protein